MQELRYRKIWQYVSDGNGNMVKNGFFDTEAYLVDVEVEITGNDAILLDSFNQLTVTLANGKKFSADPQSISNISLEMDAMLENDTRTWYEDWATFEVTKLELQDAKKLASEARQAKLAELYGV